LKPCIAAVVGLLLLAPVEAFSSATGKDVTFVSVELLDSTGTADSCDDDGVLDTGETARVRVTLRNNGTEKLTQTSMTLSSMDLDVSFPKGQEVTFPASEPGKHTSAELTMKLVGSAKPRDVALRIDYRDKEQQVSGDKTHTAVYRVNTDTLPLRSIVAPRIFIRTTQNGILTRTIFPSSGSNAITLIDSGAFALGGGCRSTFERRYFPCLSSSMRGFCPSNRRRT